MHQFQHSALPATHWLPKQYYPPSFMQFSFLSTPLQVLHAVVTAQLSHLSGHDNCHPANPRGPSPALWAWGMMVCTADGRELVWQILAQSDTDR